MTNQEVFWNAAACGIACGLSHRYEWFINANRMLNHGVYGEIPDRYSVLLTAFIEFEKATASDPDEAAELSTLDEVSYKDLIDTYYSRKDRSLE